MIVSNLIINDVTVLCKNKFERENAGIFFLTGFPSPRSAAWKDQTVCGNRDTDFLCISNAAVRLHNGLDHIGEHGWLQSGCVRVYKKKQRVFA